MRLCIALISASVAISAPLGLYGIQDTGSASAGALFTVEVTTGVMTPIGTGIPMEAVAQQVSTIDGDAQTYYLIGFNLSSSVPNVVGVSLSSGAIVSVAPIAFTEQGFIGVGQNIAWAPDVNSVIASGQNSLGDHLYGYVDPSNGKFTQRAIVKCGNKCDDVLGGPADYAPDSHVFVAQLGTLGADPNIDFVAVNMSSGKPAAKPDCDVLETLDYDKSSGSFYGIGLQESPSVQRTLVKMSPDASSCTVVGTIPDFFMIGAGVSAIDESAGILYWIAAPGGYPVNYTLNVYNLIGTKLADASTVSSVPFCCFGSCTPPATQPDCPWSLEFNNGA